MLFLSPGFLSFADESQTECLPVTGFKIEYDDTDPTQQLPLFTTTIRENPEPLSSDMFPKYVYGFTEETEAAIQIDVADLVSDPKTSTAERIIYFPKFDSSRYRVADDALLPYCLVLVVTDSNNHDPENEGASIDPEETLPIDEDQAAADDSDINEPANENGEEAPDVTPEPESSPEPEPQPTPTETAVPTPEPTTENTEDPTETASPEPEREQEESQE